MSTMVIVSFDLFLSLRFSFVVLAWFEAEKKRREEKEQRMQDEYNKWIEQARKKRQAKQARRNEDE